VSAPWEWVTVTYFSYFTLVAFTDRRFAHARWLAAGALALCVAVIAAMRHLAPPTIVAALVPALLLLGGYWLSGRFFTGPMPRAEQWLLDTDRRILGASGVFDAYGAAPRIVPELLELAYLLVYAVVPAGAVTLVLGGHGDAAPRYWAVVLTAEFASYGALPWVQTRSPRVLEHAIGGTPPRSLMRRLNLSVLGRGSIQVNTVPSGHAAGAVAVGLAVAGSMPLAGALFLVLALAIVTSTVIGRYHYLMDSLLGVGVALLAWAIWG
jgi:hypothetical protein